MAKKKAEDEKPSALWKDTFSDLMNLLLCFFVLLFSMSTVDQDKFQELAASLSAAFSVLPSGGSALQSEGILVGSGVSQLNELSEYYNSMGMSSDADISQDSTSAAESAYEQVQQEGLEQSEQMAENIQKQLENMNVASEVEISTTSQYVMLSLSGGVLFDSGKAELKEEAISLIDKVSDSIKQYDDNTISIEGHTDNVPQNTAQYPDNMVLSMYRAYAVYNYFVNTKGFDSGTMSSTGRGEYVPVASNSTAEGRAQNRRVEIKIYNMLNS
jgi:chemotaxis protein MotB